MLGRRLKTQSELIRTRARGFRPCPAVRSPVPLSRPVDSTGFLDSVPVSEPRFTWKIIGVQGCAIVFRSSKDLRFSITFRRNTRVQSSCCGRSRTRRTRKVHTRHVHQAKRNPSRSVRRTASYIAPAAYERGGNFWVAHSVECEPTTTFSGCTNVRPQMEREINMESKKNGVQTTRYIVTFARLLCLWPASGVTRIIYLYIIHARPFGRLRSEPRIQGVRNGTSSPPVKNLNSSKVKF